VTLNQGGALTLTYSLPFGFVPGVLNLWICYSSKSGSNVPGPITCGPSGTASTVDSNSQHPAVVCTPSVASGDAVTLTWVESAQDGLIARACTSATDIDQANNALVTLSLPPPISVAVAPTTLHQGAELTLTYGNYVSGQVWICYQSASTILAIGAMANACGAAGTATSVSGTYSSSTNVCTASTTTGAAVSLTFADSTQKYLRARACTSATDTTQAQNSPSTLTLAPISVTITPTTLGQGDTLTFTYGNYVSGPVWLCYQSSSTTGGVGSSPACGAAGTATSVSGTYSSSTSVCTASTTTGAAVSLTFADATQKNLRARACTSQSDTTQADNLNVPLTTLISVMVTPTTLGQGDTLTASMIGWTTPSAVWLCYRSSPTGVYPAPACAAAGTANTITNAGSGAAVVCTASASTGAAVSLTWTDSEQTDLRLRACTSATDTAQIDNPIVKLTLNTITAVLAFKTLSVSCGTASEGSVQSAVQAHVATANGVVTGVVCAGPGATTTTPTSTPTSTPRAPAGRAARR
jgi:hypothetical protein